MLLDRLKKGLEITSACNKCGFNMQCSNMCLLKDVLKQIYEHMLIRHSMNQTLDERLFGYEEIRSEVI